MENAHIVVSLELRQNSRVRFAKNFRVSLQRSEGQIGRGILDPRPRIQKERGRTALEE